MGKATIGCWGFLLILSLHVLTATSRSHVVNARRDEDLYALLGVARTATTKQIKSAYRRKALDTHPDKRHDLPPEEAAEEFHRVVHAFEVLTDVASRRRYDQKGRVSQQQQHASQKKNHHFYYNQPPNQNPSREPGEGADENPKSRRRKLRIREAMSRVLHLMSLEQLMVVMLDDDRSKLERHVLICFVTHGDVDKVSERMFYPYPFAGILAGGIFWETMLQTTKVPYTRENDMTRFFKIPKGDALRESGKPIFLFGRRGEPLSQNLERIQTSSHEELEEWVWDKMKVTVEFVNKHSHPVLGYLIQDEGNNTQSLFQLDPGESTEIATRLSHEFWVKDARVDTHPDVLQKPTKFTQESMVGVYNIDSDEIGQQIVIHPKSCFDFSGYCVEWKQDGACTNRKDGKDVTFVQELCPFSCQICNDKNDEFRPTRFGDEL